MTPSRPVEAPKALQVLRGAKAAFFELGYEGTSVDEIARRAGVSKATLYSHFEDKRAIFSALIKQECNEQASRLLRFDETDSSATETLHRLAREYVGFLLSPFAMEMFRLVIAEVLRFPEIGREFYESGPALAIRRLAQFLAAAAAKGELGIPDAHVAAHQFLSLCRGEMFFFWLLRMKTEATPEEIEETARVAVDTFLRAYRQPVENQPGMTND